jgi:phenylpropionate dioxygenase-like ring-hydroxylating dioxygenase large terminal subunit
MMKDHWYAVLETREVKKRKPLGVKRLGERLVFWRDDDGILSCMADRCVHRGAALSSGKVVANRIQCPFHGFEFDHKGRCQCIPANGRLSPVPKAFQMQSFPVREAHGFIWVWWGKEREEYPPLPFFADIDETFNRAGLKDEWSVDYTRAIENQLDVFHLPFVHATTIGRGNRTIADGPVAILGNEGMEIQVYNRVDNGTKALRPDDIPEPYKSPQLVFLFPNLWMNRISDDFRIVLAFVPVDDENCILYLHQYQRIVKMPIIKEVFNAISICANRIILNQDKRVVLTQRPLKSSLDGGEKLIVQDRPIILFRMRRQEFISQQNHSVK